MHILAFDPMSLILPDLGLLFWMTLIFLLFWFLMGKFAFKPIVKAIKDRERSIDDALSAADKAKSEMQQLQSDNAALLKAVTKIIKSSDKGKAMGKAGAMRARKLFSIEQMVAAHVDLYRSIDLSRSNVK